MRIKIIGDNNCARATRHLLRLAGFAVTDFLPVEAVTQAPHSGFAITIELAPAPQPLTPPGEISGGTPSEKPDQATHGQPAAVHGEASSLHGGASSRLSVGRALASPPLNSESVETGVPLQTGVENGVAGDVGEASVRMRKGGLAGQVGEGSVRMRKGGLAEARPTGDSYIHFDSCDSELEAAVLRHVAQLAAAPVVVDRPGGVVHSERELRIVVPVAAVVPETGAASSGHGGCGFAMDEAAAVAVEFGVLRGLLDLSRPAFAKASAGRPGSNDARDSAGRPGSNDARDSAGRPGSNDARDWAGSGEGQNAGVRAALEGTGAIPLIHPRGSRLAGLQSYDRGTDSRDFGDVSAEFKGGLAEARPTGGGSGRRGLRKKWWIFGAVIVALAAFGVVRVAFAGVPAQGQFATGSGVKIFDGTNTLVVDPCKGQAKSFVSINQTANAQLAAGTASKKIYICSIHVVVAAATNVALVEGTGSVCATGTAGVGGFGGATAATGWNFGANGGIVLGNGEASVGGEGTSADNLCLFNSGSGQVSGGISYVVQ